jgi:hypothetical protein
LLGLCFIEHPKGYNVVNIQSAATQRFINTAISALMPISASSFSLLALPIRAVIRRASTAPAGVILTRPVARLPLSEASMIAESHFALGSEPKRATNWLAAIVTRAGICSFPAGRFFPNKPTIEGFRHAVARAIVNFATPVSRATVKLLSALGTNQISRCPLWPTSPSLYAHDSLLCNEADQVSIISQNGEFMGIGSEAFTALKFGRKAIGIELKPSYFQLAIRNLRSIETEQSMPTLFDFAAIEQAAR